MGPGGRRQVRVELAPLQRQGLTSGRARWSRPARARSRAKAVGATWSGRRKAKDPSPDVLLNGHDVPVDRTPIKYALSGDVHVAYQVSGEGPFDLVMAPGTVSHLDLAWEYPASRRSIEMWSSISRLIRFDKRGTGLSDRPTRVATLEERADDIRAVLDAVGVERAVIFGGSEGGQMACMFAALYPDRTQALITWGAMARWNRTDDHPWGLTDEENDELLRNLDEEWPNEWYIRGPGAGLGPDADPELVEYFMRLSQLGASPAAAVALEAMNHDSDVTDILPSISVPTLVMCSSDDPVAPAGGVKWMADRIPNAVFRTFPSNSHSWGDNIGAVIAAVQEMVTGTRAPIHSTRRLLTLLFVDVVGSTQQATSMGDAAWHDLMQRYYVRVEQELAGFDGREVDRAGDGLFAVFDGPTRAIRCAQAIQREARLMGIALRAGVHTGEVEVDHEGVRGIAVHVAARVCAAAAAGELFTTSTVRDLTAGADLLVEDRGMHVLKGVDGERQLFAVQG